ncbi:hypothetical protein J6590_045598 [Homalodisca vitripennis]|nr:hypothetical protein J6590_045598 [Homalodisca vitripennis]
MYNLSESEVQRELVEYGIDCDGKADDLRTKLVKAYKEDRPKATQSLGDNATQPCANIGFMLNADKCTVLHTSPHNLMQTAGVLPRGKVKTLGVLPDGNLTFTDHVSHTYQRALGRQRGLHMFRRLECAKLQLMES